MAAVFLLKLAVLLQLKDHPLLQADAGLDTTVYVELARRVMDGDFAAGAGLYFVSPLYIYFLAPVLAVAGNLTAVRVVQIALGTVAVALIYVATREWFGVRAGVLAAAFAALTGLFTFYEVLILQAALDPFLTAAALSALALALHRGGRLWPALAGAAFGGLTLSRPNALIAVAGVTLLLVVLIRRRESAALFVVGLLLSLAPTTLRNGLVAGHWTPLASHGGLNFYIGNNAQADGTYRSVPGITPNIAGQRDDARRVAEEALGRRLDDSAVSTYFFDRAVGWIAAEPAAAAVLFARKVRYTLSAAHLSLNYSFPFFARDVATLLPVLMIGPWLLIPLGFAGLVFAAPPDRRREYVVWLAFLPFYIIAVAAFFAAERYRLPLLVPCCVGAGAASDRLWAAITRRQAKGLTPLAVAVVSLAVFVNWPLGLDDGRVEAQLRMAERLIQRERYQEAEAWIARATAAPHGKGLAHFRVGRALLAKGRADLALPHLQEAANVDPEHAETSFALGQALLDAGRSREAVPHLRRAFDAGVRPDLSGFDLSRALASTGQRSEALAVLSRVTPARPDDAGSWYGLGQLARQLGDPALALRFYREAARVAPDAADPREQIGLMHALLGDFASAIRELETAVKLDPSDAAGHLNLAVALARSGRLADARTHARTALQIDPSYERARELLRVLEKQP